MRRPDRQQPADNPRHCCARRTPRPAARRDDRRCHRRRGDGGVDVAKDTAHHARTTRASFSLWRDSSTARFSRDPARSSSLFSSQPSSSATSAAAFSLRWIAFAKRSRLRADRPEAAKVRSVLSSPLLSSSLRGPLRARPGPLAHTHTLTIGGADARSRARNTRAAALTGSLAARIYPPFRNFLLLLLLFFSFLFFFFYLSLFPFLPFLSLFLSILDGIPLPLLAPRPRTPPRVLPPFLFFLFLYRHCLYYRPFLDRDAVPPRIRALRVVCHVLAAAATRTF